MFGLGLCRVILLARGRVLGGMEPGGVALAGGRGLGRGPGLGRGRERGRGGPLEPGRGREPEPERGKGQGLELLDCNQSRV